MKLNPIEADIDVPRKVVFRPHSWCVRLRHVVQLTDTALLDTSILPRLSRRILVCAPAQEAQNHAEAQQQERDESSIESKSRLSTDGTEVAVAHVRGQRKVLTKGR